MFLHKKNCYNCFVHELTSADLGSSCNQLTMFLFDNLYSFEIVMSLAFSARLNFDADSIFFRTEVKQSFISLCIRWAIFSRIFPFSNCVCVCLPISNAHVRTHIPNRTDLCPTFCSMQSTCISRDL